MTKGDVGNGCNLLNCGRVKMGFGKQLLRVHGMVYAVHSALSSFFQYILLSSLFSYTLFNGVGEVVRFPLKISKSFWFGL
jgi:hypothetical protein